MLKTVSQSFCQKILEENGTTIRTQLVKAFSHRSYMIIGKVVSLHKMMFAKMLKSNFLQLQVKS